MDEQRVVEEVGKVVVGIHLCTFFHGWQVVQHRHKLLQGITVLREVGGQGIGKTLITLGKQESLFSDGYLVEALRVQPMPGQTQQS